MTRPILTVPSNNQEWDNLPEVFCEFLDKVDTIRQYKADLEVIDPLYPSYDYDWDVDSTIPLETLIYYWNRIEHPLPEPATVVDEINSALGEAAYDSYVSEAYSY